MILPEHVEVENNVLLHIRDWGEGKPVVFVHGWPFNHRMFEYQFIRLPRHGYRCIGITLRGFGRSSQPWCDYSYDMFSDDLQGIFETLELEDATLVGFSMGGAVTLRYLSRHGDAHVARLVLAGAAAPVFTMRPGATCGFEQGTIDRIIELCCSDRARMAREVVERLFRNKEAVGPELKEWFHAMAMEASPHATAACLGLLRDSDLHGDLQSVRVPTVVFHGVHDRICPLELAEALTAVPEAVTAGPLAIVAGGAAGEPPAPGIRGARLVRFESSGHALFYEEKEKFNLDLISFIEDRLFRDRTYVSESVL